MKHSDVTQLTGSQFYRVKWLFSLFAVVLLLAFVYDSDSRSQNIAQKAPAITFHFSGDTNNTNLLKKGKTDDPLDMTACCNAIEATLTQIPNPCTSSEEKGSTPQDATSPCCCAVFAVSDPCTSPVCEITIAILNGTANPICCVNVPPGWTYHDYGPVPPEYSDFFAFDYTSPGTNCIGAIDSTPVNFTVCGFNTSVPIQYMVTVAYCSVNKVTGACEPGSKNDQCSGDFTSTISCGNSEVDALSEPQSLSVTEGYPNPASSSILFNYKAPKQGIMTLTMVDMLGTSISSTNRLILSGYGSVTIGLAGARPGNYYCVFDLNGDRVTKRIEIK